MAVSFGRNGRNQGRAASMLVTAAEILSTGGKGNDTPVKEMHRETRQVGERDKNDRKKIYKSAVCENHS